MLPYDNQILDRALLARIQNGEETAKEDLVRKYAPMVHRIVRGRIGNWSEYDDLCQEGMIGLLKAINEYDPGRYAVKFSTFAYICILRRVSNAVKQTLAKKQLLFKAALSLGAGSTEDVRAVKEEAAKGSDPLEYVLSDWSERRLRAVLCVYLSQVEYAVIDLLLQGMSTTEIQAALALGSKAVDNARTRARCKLRRLVEEYGSLLNPELPLRARKRLDLAMKIKVS